MQGNEYTMREVEKLIFTMKKGFVFEKEHVFLLVNRDVESLHAEISREYKWVRWREGSRAGPFVHFKYEGVIASLRPLTFFELSLLDRRDCEVIVNIPVRGLSGSQFSEIHEMIGRTYLVLADNDEEILGAVKVSGVQEAIYLNSASQMLRCYLKDLSAGLAETYFSAFFLWLKKYIYKDLKI